MSSYLATTMCHTVKMLHAHVLIKTYHNARQCPNNNKHKSYTIQVIKEHSVFTALNYILFSQAKDYQRLSTPTSLSYRRQMFVSSCSTREVSRRQAAFKNHSYLVREHQEIVGVFCKSLLCRSLALITPPVALYRLFLPWRAIYLVLGTILWRMGSCMESRNSLCAG